jgi:hypothetical protein
MTVSQSGWPEVKARIFLLRCVLRLSQITMTGESRVAVRGGDQGGVVCLGHGPAGSGAQPVTAHPVVEPAWLPGLEAGQAGDRDPSGAPAGDPDHRRVPAAAPGAGHRRLQRLPGLVLEADPRPGRRR